MKPAVCALVSGGLDSCALLAHLATRYRRVYPVFLRQGYNWEPAELRALRRFLRATGIRHERLLVLHSPVAAVLSGRHWSRTGRRVPGADTPDAAVYLPGRNLMLLAQAALVCERHRIPDIALGSLGHNPFADATPAFFRDFGRLAGVRVLAPFRQRTKAAIVRRYRRLPLHVSLSCLAPRGGRHCGRCNKCAERRQAFRVAGVRDLTIYRRS